MVIKAGSDGDTQDFHAHEDVIKEKSDFFKAAFDRKWREGQSRELELPEDEPSTVSGYLEWLYSGQVKTKRQQDLSLDDRIDQDDHLSKMYVFGEKVQDNAFCDAIMHNIARDCDEDCDDGRWVLGDAAIRTLYDGTLGGSPVRRFLVDLHVARGSLDWVNADTSTYHGEFLHDLTKAMFRRHAAPGYKADKHKAMKHIGRYLKEGSQAREHDASSGDDLSFDSDHE